VNITVNRNTVPFDERRRRRLGVRIGTPACTMRGFDEDDFREVGASSSRRCRRRRRRRARGARAALCEQRPLYPGFRGYTTYDGLSRPTASTVVTHPLVQHKLSYLRDKDTPTVHFRKLVNEVTLLLTYEATKDFPTEPVEIETPLETMTAQRISGKKVAVCPVLRAGSGCSTATLSLISSARVGFIGMYRDEETLEAIRVLREAARRPRRARRDRARPDARDRQLERAAIAAGEGGRARVGHARLPGRRAGGDRARAREHPDVHIVCALVDRGLNERGFIVPGSATRATASTARSSTARDDRSCRRR
jgi:uracil phosphoribosyltransferase